MMEYFLHFVKFVSAFALIIALALLAVKITSVQFGTPTTTSATPIPPQR